MLESFSLPSVSNCSFVWLEGIPSFLDLGITLPTAINY